MRGWCEDGNVSDGFLHWLSSCSSSDDVRSEAEEAQTDDDGGYVSHVGWDSEFDGDEDPLESILFNFGIGPRIVGLRPRFLTPDSAGRQMRANLGLNNADSLKAGEPTPASEKGLRAGPVCEEPNLEMEGHSKPKGG